MTRILQIWVGKNMGRVNFGWPELDTQKKGDRVWVEPVEPEHDPFLMWVNFVSISDPTQTQPRSNQKKMFDMLEKKNP